MPRRSPSARSSASPNASAVSSTVWWSPVSRSPERLDDEVEARVEGELLEEVVVDPGAGLTTRTRLAPSSPSRTAMRVSAVARRCRTRRPARRGDRRAGRSSMPRERLDEQVVVDLVADRDPDAVVVGAHDEPLVEQAPAELAAVVVAARRGSSRARRAAAARSRAAPRRAARAPRSPARTSGGDASAATASAAETRRDGRGRLPRVELGRDLTRGERVADPRAGEAEGLRERAQRRSRRRRAAASPSRRSTRSTPRRRRAAAPSGSGRSSPVGLFGRHVNVSDAGPRPSPTSAPASCAAIR